ncbi:rano class II histocompatibility antigen, A beta chain-like [Alligator mississippiensis]|uniref:Rano class II histocompatibility antigen, A beta chain-like n=1 Tax=Alligator mississippiensis TaxID=8496 RepID=A0A151M5P9_ALLMI|nr:rano class II histocompatibility antigen, A beta chain-like [Alligator mississippiensis]
MADKYDHLIVADLRELMKERGLPVRKEQKREDLIKILCDNDQATRSPPAVHTEPMGDTVGPPFGWEVQKLQLRLEAEEQEHKLKHELELERMELEAQHQREELETREAQRGHEAREAQLQCEHELAVLQMQANANTVGAQPALDASPRLNTPILTRYKAGDDPEVFLSIFENQAPMEVAKGRVHETHGCSGRG